MADQGIGYKGRLASALPGLAVLVAWLVLQFFPGVLNGPPTTIGRFQIYGARQFDQGELHRIVAAAERHLGRYPHPLPSPITVVFSTGHWYRVFHPMAWNAFAATNIANDVWFNRIDYLRPGFAFTGMGERSRSIEGVLAHEATHVAMRETYGLYARWKAPAWIHEGYCDFVASESSMAYPRGIAQVRAASVDTSPAYFYFKSRLAVTELIEREAIPIDEIMRSPEIHGMSVDELASKYARSLPGD